MKRVLKILGLWRAVALAPLALSPASCEPSSLPVFAGRGDA